MEQILLSVSVFTVVVLILVLILNFAESQLLPQGDVTVEINGNPEKSITTRPGSRYSVHWLDNQFSYLQHVEVEELVRCVSAKYLKVVGKYYQPRQVI